jgi:hypothetical protein
MHNDPVDRPLEIFGGKVTLRFGAALALSSIRNPALRLLLGSQYPCAFPGKITRVHKEAT